MKKSNMIDLTTYFTQTQSVDISEPKLPTLAVKLCRIMGSALNVAATAAIALCVCACTLLFFTML